MRLPVLRRTASPSPAPAEPVIHYEVLDGQSGTLLDWGSTTDLDTVVESATKARADLAGRWTHVRRLTEPSWATTASWPESTGTATHVRANRVRAAVSDLRRAVEDAQAAGVGSDLLRQAADPDLTTVRALLLGQAEDGPDLLDLPTWNPNYPDNLDRAAWAARALTVFGQSTGQLRGGDGADAELVEEMAGDLVCDLMHLLDHVGGDAQTTIERGIGHHDYEVAEEAAEADDTDALESAA
jgi:hypothetical protein